jgi:hypothetical protein
VLHNGLGHYHGAFAAAQWASARDDLGLYGWALTELIEVGTRTGQPEAAAAALKKLAERTSASGTERALGIEARSRALLYDGPAADALYREAIERLDRTRIRADLARAHLVYGEWLRREQWRVDAREHLRAAHDMFGWFGAAAFAERARRELQATGETVRKRTMDRRGPLSVQEAQAARLAAGGHTNPEIGAQLFISPGPRSTTCARCSPSSASAPAGSSGTAWRNPDGAPPEGNARDGELRVGSRAGDFDGCERLSAGGTHHPGAGGRTACGLNRTIS